MVPDLHFATMSCTARERKDITDALRSVLPVVPHLAELTGLDEVATFMQQYPTTHMLFCQPGAFSKGVDVVRTDENQSLTTITWLSDLNDIGMTDGIMNYVLRSGHAVHDLECAITSHVRQWTRATVTSISRTYDDLFPRLTDLSEVETQYMAFLRDAVGASSISHYSLGGREKHLHLRRSIGANLQPSIPYRVARSMFRFQRIPATVLLSDQASRSLFVERAATLSSTVVVSSFISEQSTPALTAFEFASPVRPGELLDLCQIATSELRHIDRGIESDRRMQCIRNIAEAQQHLPHRHNVLWAICRELMSYFQVDGASILLVTDARGDEYCFEKVYTHHGREESTRFWTDYGYAHHCVRHGTAAIITETDNEAQIGTGLQYDTADLHAGHGKPVTIRFTRAPHTVEDETSLILLPLVKRYGDGATYGVVKIGEFADTNAFNTCDLHALYLFGEQISSVMYSIESAEQLEAAHDALDQKATLQDEAEDLFVYRNLVLETFHQISSSLDNADLKLVSAELRCKALASSSQAFKTDKDAVGAALTSALDSTKDGKKLLKIMIDRGRTLKPVMAPCLLIEDVLRPAVKRAERRVKGKWSIHHAFGKGDYRVEIDELLVRESVVNVLNNAIWAVDARHRRADSKSVRITLRRMPNQNCVRIKIRDNGVGISPENQRRVFDQFFTTRKKGTGLGLFLAQRIISYVGGSICIERSSEDSETIMAIDLPFERTTK